MSTSAIGLLVAIVMIVVIWFVFVAPAERRYHERKLKLMQERIERRQRHLQERQSNKSAEMPEVDQ